MSTDRHFVDYLHDQLGGAGAVSFRKMFGEYAMYCDTKVVALVCDNQLFVKPTGAGRAALGAAAIEGQPYPGAKPWLLIGDLLEDRAALLRLIRLTAAELPLPVPKKPRPGRAGAAAAAAAAPSRTSSGKSSDKSSAKSTKPANSTKGANAASTSGKASRARAGKPLC
jgi:TfoX/Sxy family transcriptional regulator of competence genes